MEQPTAALKYQEVLTRALDELAHDLREGQFFKINRSAERAARAFRLVTDEGHAHLCFALAAEASYGEALELLARKKLDEGIRWSFLFETSWLYLQAARIQDAREGFEALARVARHSTRPLRAAEAVQLVLGLYLCGLEDSARGWYERLNLKKHTGQIEYSTVNLLQALLYTEERSKYLDLSEQRLRQIVAEEQIQPWHADNWHYDLLRIIQEVRAQGRVGLPPERWASFAPPGQESSTTREQGRYL